MKRSKKIANRPNPLELPRKALHASIGFCVLYLYHLGISQKTAFLLCLVTTTFVLGIEACRFYLPAFNHFILSVLSAFSRSKETKNLTGSFYFILGIDFCIALLPIRLAVLAILLASWCDPIASLSGRLFGKYTFVIRGKKTFAGAIGCFLAGFFTSQFYFSSILHQNLSVAWYLFCGALACASELVNVCGLNDNLIMPILTGTALTLAGKLIKVEGLY
jgi:diacylglycerol kinase (CTP)